MQAPKFEVKDGHLYTDGIRAEWWQLTPEERAKVNPERFRIEDLAGDIECPMCRARVDGTDRRAMSLHLRQMHMDWYRPQSEAVKNCADLKELLAYIEAHPTVPEEAEE